MELCNFPQLPCTSEPITMTTKSNSYRDLHRILGVNSGDEVLYVGDHIFGDIVTSKRCVCWCPKWTTCLRLSSFVWPPQECGLANYAGGTGAGRRPVTHRAKPQSELPSHAPARSPAFDFCHFVHRPAPMKVHMELGLLREQRDIIDDEVQRYEWALTQVRDGLSKLAQEM